MVRKILITACLNLLVILPLFSQTTVTWSALDTQDKRAPLARKMFLNDKYAYYFVRQSAIGDHFYIDLFDASTLEKIKQIEVYPEFKLLQGKFGGIMMLKDKLLSYKSKGYISYAKKITTAGDVDPSEVKVAVIEGKANATSFSYQTNRNYDKLLLMENTELKDDKNKTTMTLFDLNLKPIWSKTVPISIDNQRFKAKSYFVQKYVLTTEGNVYLLVGFKKEDSKDQYEYFYNLYFFDPNKEELKEMVLDIDDKKFISISFNLNMKNEVAVMGTYSENAIQKETFLSPNESGIYKKHFSIAGVFYFNAKMNKINAKTVHPFEPAFLSTMDEKALTKDKKEIYAFSFDGMYVDENMNGFLLGQQYYNVEPGPHANIAHGFSNDTYVIKIKNDGALDWEKSIRKSQTGSGQSIAFTSYDYFYNGEKIFILFNDHPDNAKLSLNQIYDKKSFTELVNFKKSVCTLVTLDPQGTETRNTLFVNDGRDLIYSPFLSSHKQNSNEALIYSINDGAYKLGKLKLK
jgi:hypothetical protein